MKYKLCIKLIFFTQRIMNSLLHVSITGIPITNILHFNVPYLQIPAHLQGYVPSIQQ